MYRRRESCRALGSRILGCAALQLSPPGAGRAGPSCGRHQLFYVLLWINAANVEHIPSPGASQGATAVLRLRMCKCIYVEGKVEERG